MVSRITAVSRRSSSRRGRGPSAFSPARPTGARAKRTAANRNGRRKRLMEYPRSRIGEAGVSSAVAGTGHTGPVHPRVRGGHRVVTTCGGFFSEGRSKGAAAEGRGAVVEQLQFAQ